MKLVSMLIMFVHDVSYLGLTKSHFRLSFLYRPNTAVVPKELQFNNPGFKNELAETGLSDREWRKIFRLSQSEPVRKPDERTIF